MRMAGSDSRTQGAGVAVGQLVHLALALQDAHTSLKDLQEARDTEFHLIHTDDVDAAAEVAVPVAKDLSTVDHCTFYGAEKALVMAWTLEKVLLANVDSTEDTAHSWPYHKVPAPSKMTQVSMKFLDYRRSYQRRDEIPVLQSWMRLLQRQPVSPWPDVLDKLLQTFAPCCSPILCICPNLHHGPLLQAFARNHHLHWDSVAGEDIYYPLLAAGKGKS